MSTGHISYIVKRGVGIISINHQEKANSFTFNLLEEFFNALNEADMDKKVKCLLLKSSGDKIFSAGFDLTNTGLGSAEFSSKIFELGGKITQKMIFMKKPIIVQVQGTAIGFGFMLIMASDLKIFANKLKEDMYFKMPEMALKGYPRAGGVVLPLLEFGITFAKRILLTSDEIGLKELIRLNIPTRIFPPDDLEIETWNFMKSFSKHPLAISSLIKSSLTLMDKSYIKRCYELEETCGKAAYDQKSQDDLDSFIKYLNDNYSKL